jgi:hypothetical protein
VELYLHSPSTLSWHGVQLKESTGKTLRKARVRYMSPYIFNTHNYSTSSFIVAPKISHCRRVVNIQKFPERPPGERNANSTAVCH